MLDHGSETRAAAEAVGTPCIDGTTLSAADVRRNADHVVAQHDLVRRAVYAVASHAGDAEECRSLLDMMGVDLATVRAAREAGLRHRLA